MKVVHASEADNKTYTDKHEFHVKRNLPRARWKC